VGRKMNRGPRGTPSGIDWRPWAFVIGLVVLLLWGVVSGSEPLFRGLDAARNTVAKSREYKRIVAENKWTEAELEFYNTEAGQAYCLGKDLGYIREGEQVAEVVVEEGSGTGLKFGERVRNCLVDAMNSMSLRARDTRDVIWCLLGFLEPVMPEEDIAAQAPVQ